MGMDLEFTILLPGGGVFRFAGPFPVSCGQWEHIRAVMDAMAPGLIADLASDPSCCERFGTAIEGPRCLPDRLGGITSTL
jgi:hypothetical protein